MCKQRIHEDLYQISYEVQFRNPNILEILYPIATNQRRYEAAIQKTRAMYMRNWKKAPWAVRKAEETFLEELEEGKIRVVPEKEFLKAMETEHVNFSANNLVFNMDSSSTKVRLIHEYTEEVRKTTLSLWKFSQQKMDWALW